MHYLYKITNQLNQKVYVGQTVNDKTRWTAHKSFAKTNQPIQYIHRAMAKYGIENFLYEVIATCQTQEDADEIEKQLIVQYNSRNKEMGYNVSPGGDIAWNRGLPKEQQPMYGKHHSKESRLKISESNMGKIMPLHTQEWKYNMSQIMTGRDITWNNKISSSKKGMIISEDEKNRLRSLRKGSSLSQDSKLKISKALVGRIGPRGENSGHAKLTWALVIQIREEFSKGNISKSKLAKKYNVSQPTIKNIVNNETWKV